jgi:hypothetical protein
MMGIDAFGPLLIMLALSLMAVPPLQMTLARPRSVRQPAPLFLHNTFPAPAPVPELERLVQDADQALAADQLISTTVAIAETYDQA